MLDALKNICKKYNGLLYNENQSDERLNLLEQKARSRVLQLLASVHLNYEHLIVLLYDNNSVYNGKQARLYFPAELASLGRNQCICLVLFDFNSTLDDNETERNPILLRALCPIDSAKWNMSRIVDRCYRIIGINTEVAQLQFSSAKEKEETDPTSTSSSLLPDDTNNNNNNNNMNIQITKEEENEVEEEGVNISMEEEEEDGEETTALFYSQLTPELLGEWIKSLELPRYRQFLLNHRLCYSNKEDQLANLNYYRKYSDNYSRASAFYLCQVIYAFTNQVLDRHNNNNNNETEDGETPLLTPILLDKDLIYNKEYGVVDWIETEIMRRGDRPRRLVWFDRAATVLAQNLPRGLHPAWLDYRLKGENLFWCRDSRDKKKIRIRWEWILRKEFATLRSTLCVTEGETLLTQGQFNSIFQPLLMRTVLRDIILMIYHQIYVNHSAFASLMESIPHANPPESTTKEELRLYCEQYGDPDSPIIVKYLKAMDEKEAIDLTRQQNTYYGGGGGNYKAGGGGGYDRSRNQTHWQFKRSELPDIENIAEVLPPCLKNLTTHRKGATLGNSDRLNATKYLHVMGYGDSEILRLLNPSGNQKYNYDLQGNLKSFHKDRQKALETTMCCYGVINNDKGTRNIFRCHYEEKKNGTSRINYKTTPGKSTEREQFTIDCLTMHFGDMAFVDGLRITNPLEFVSHRLNTK